MAMFEKQTVYQSRVNLPRHMTELTHSIFHMAMDFNDPTQLNVPRDFFAFLPEPFRKDALQRPTRYLDKYVRLNLK